MEQSKRHFNTTLEQTLHFTGAHGHMHDRRNDAGVNLLEISDWERRIIADPVTEGLGDVSHIQHALYFDDLGHALSAL